MGSFESSRLHGPIAKIRYLNICYREKAKKIIAGVLMLGFSPCGIALSACSTSHPPIVASLSYDSMSPSLQYGDFSYPVEERMLFL